MGQLSRTFQCGTWAQWGVYVCVCERVFIWSCRILAHRKKKGKTQKGERKRGDRDKRGNEWGEKSTSGAGKLSQQQQVASARSTLLKDNRLPSSAIHAPVFHSFLAPPPFFRPLFPQTQSAIVAFWFREFAVFAVCIVVCLSMCAHSGVLVCVRAICVYGGGESGCVWHVPLWLCLLFSWLWRFISFV